MQNALNTVGPVDQAKRSVLHLSVSHGSGANLCSSYFSVLSHSALSPRVSLPTSVAVLGLHLGHH